jgi:hypothetical protein
MKLRDAIALSLFLGLARIAHAQVPCTSPDDFCVGDPCYTISASVVSPCVVDFGDRFLVINKRIKMPEGGILEFRARRIWVKSSITAVGNTGGSITLIADDLLEQRGKVDASGAIQAGTVVLLAGGNVALDGKVKAAARFRSSATAGGTVAIDAGGLVTCSARCGVDVRGQSVGAGGSAIYRGAAGVDVIGHLVAEGGVGPHIEYTSSGGAVTVGTDIRMRSTLAEGGYILLAGATSANITRSIEARGKTTGGTIELVAPAVNFVPGARAPGATGGQVLVTAGTVNAIQNIEANGTVAGGLVRITADDITIGSAARANGSGQGGRVELTASTGNMSLQGAYDVRGGGGTIEASAAGDLTAQATFQAAGGCIGLSAGGTLTTTGSSFDGPVTPSCP